jgi:hypothetical protein
MSSSSYRSSEGSDIEVVIKGPSTCCPPASGLSLDALEVLDAFPGHTSQLGTSSSVMQEQVRSRLGFFDESRLRKTSSSRKLHAAAAILGVLMQLLYVPRTSVSSSLLVAASVPATPGGCLHSSVLHKPSVDLEAKQGRPSNTKCTALGVVLPVV